MMNSRLHTILSLLAIGLAAAFLPLLVLPVWAGVNEASTNPPVAIFGIQHGI